MMLNVIRFIDFDDIVEAVPAFFTMFIIPITKSLTIGIAFGIISYVIVNLFTGRKRKIKNILYVLAVLFVIMLILLPR